MPRVTSLSASLRLGLALALSICLSGTTALMAAQKPQRAAKDFLPPVALINGSLTIEQLEGKTEDEDLSMGPVVFSAVSPNSVKLSERPTTLQGSLKIENKHSEADTLVTCQQQLDEKDLKALWEATVDHNPVIRFSLEKLAMPIDLQPKHSSRFLNKTLAAMVNGAAMGAMMMTPGMGAYQNMGVATVSQAAQNVLLGNNKPQASTLTATEQIQLASLIDDLKANLVQNYQSYKKTLEQLAQARAVSLKNNNLYSNALKTSDPLARMAAGSAYYKAQLNETELRQQAMLYRLKLERLAGREAVNNLQLAVLVNGNTKTSQAETAPTASIDTPSTTVNTLSTNHTDNTVEEETAEQITSEALHNIEETTVNKAIQEESAPPQASHKPDVEPSKLPEAPLSTNTYTPAIKAADNDMIGPIKPQNSFSTLKYAPAEPLLPAAAPVLDGPPVPPSPDSYYQEGK